MTDKAHTPDSVTPLYCVHRLCGNYGTEAALYMPHPLFTSRKCCVGCGCFLAPDPEPKGQGAHTFVATHVPC